jgi:predicted GNAT family N-acyltransferase
MMDCKIIELPWDSEFQTVLKDIRFEVFVKEQNVPLELELDEMDIKCTHLLALDENNNGVGTLRISPGGKLGRLAVFKKFRKRGTGKQLVNHAILMFENRKFPEIYLDSQVDVTGFYESLGFIIDNEKIFMDAGIPHKRMIFSKKTK